MELSLVRNLYSAKSTIGDLYVNLIWECFTLEDRIRFPGVKIPKRTCIPAGRYQIAIVMSPKRHMDVPLLLNVPMFTGIEIHSGNTEEDTEGCILVGKYRLDNEIRASRLAYAALFTKLSAAHQREEETWITIANTPGTDYDRLTVPDA